MRSCTWFLGVAGLLALSSVLIAQEAAPAGLKVGDTLPGPFQSLNVTGPFAGRFHSTVTENDLKPGVLIFVREVPAADSPLAKLLQGLDALPLGTEAVVLGDGDYKKAVQGKVDPAAAVADLELTKAILAKEEKIGALAALAKEAKLAKVVLSLAPADEVTGYKVPDTAEVTVLAYSRFRVVYARSFSKDQLAAEAALKEIRDAFAKPAAPPAKGG